MSKLTVDEITSVGGSSVDFPDGISNKGANLGTAASRDVGTAQDEIETNALKDFKSFDSLTSAIVYVTANPSTIERVSTASYRSKAECTTLGIDYPDGGGADYVVDAGALVLSSAPTAKSLGAIGDGTADNTGVLSSMQAELKNNTVELGTGAFSIASNSQIEDVIYKGTGVFKTKNSPNVATSGLSSTLGLFSDGIVPERHLRQALAKAASGQPIKVVIMGDSLSTPYAEVDSYMNASADGLWGYLKRRIAKQNPHLSFEFVNRGIGGMTWTSANGNVFNTKPSNIEWYDVDKDWFDYIEDEAPDILIFSFGMNDSENIVIPQFAAVQRRALSLPTVPDIVFCTNMVPSRMSGNANISSEKSNEGRDFSAGYVRHYAQTQDFGLIDVNRHYHLVMDGTDVENTYMSRVVAGLPTSLPYTATGILCSNFNMKINMASLAAGVMNDLNSETGERLRVQTSPKISVNNPNSTSYIDIGVRNGFIAVEINDNYQTGWNPNKFGAGVGGFGYANFTTTAPAPSVGQTCNLYVTVKGSHLTVSLNNEIILEKQIRRLGQVFEPSVYSKNGTITAAATITLDQGKYAKICHPLLTDSEVWENLDSNGGNNLNHPNTKASSVIYGPVIDCANFAVPSFSVGATDYVNTKSHRTVIGGKQSKGISTIGALPAGSALVNTLPPPDANDLVIVGAGDSVGTTTLVPSTGAYRCVIATETDQRALVDSFVPALGLRKTAISGVTVQTLISPTLVNTAGIQILCNVDSVLSLKQVFIGDPDTAGTGFRALRIPN